MCGNASHHLALSHDSLLTPILYRCVFTLIVSSVTLSASLLAILLGNVLPLAVATITVDSPVFTVSWGIEGYND